MTKLVNLKRLILLFMKRMKLKIIMSLKPGDVVVSNEYGIGKVDSICGSMINVDFIEMTDITDISNWEYSFTCREDLKWYQDNCRLADAEEAQMLAYYVRRCEELMRELEEEYSTFMAEWDWEYSIDGHILEEGDYLLYENELGIIQKIRSDRKYMYLIEFTDLDEPLKGSSTLNDIEWISKYCRYLPESEAQRYLDHLNWINDYDDSISYGLSASDYYDDWSDFYDDEDFSD
ncbi:MAG: hypothetical protein J1F11_00160 [Oscillospiraceae bacterium]|nr:hypothetical protein [Oscillospiraceae bacterium]